MKRVLAFSSLAFTGLISLLTGCQAPMAAITEVSRIEAAGPGERSFTTRIPVGVTQGEVQQVVKEALSARGWTITDESEKALKAELRQQHIIGKLTVSWTQERVQIDDQSQRESGESFVPIRWINYLQQDISKGLKTAAL